jgi:glucosyl-3-phosphoglycerate synthase
MGKKKKNIQPVLPQGVRDKIHNYTVVVPVFDDEFAEWLVKIALNLAEARHGRVVLVGKVLVPDSESLTTGTAQAQACRAMLERIRDQHKGAPLYVKPRIRVEYEPWRSLAQVVSKEQADLVILPWHTDHFEDLFATPLDSFLKYIDCNVVVVSGNAPDNLKNILMPLRGSQESPLTLEVALSIAKASNAQITMLYATDEDTKPASRKIYSELARIAMGNPLIKQEVRLESAALPAILSQVQQHDMVIMGASEAEPGRGAQSVGQIPRQLKSRKSGPLMIVRSHRPAPVEEVGRWSDSSPLPVTPASVLVDKWFAENTFNSKEFKKLKRLMALKETQDLTISLGLPALNEEETIGNIIQSIKAELMDNVPLLDEIVLIDSGSSDRTVDIARDHDIPVYQHSEILPQYGAYRGKGEALWKSQFVLKGDIIAWIDTDIVNIHPRFVYGILGPLLRHRTIKYVKGFYRRPLRVGSSVQAGGGGRVTELVARPLFNLFYPELSGIVQPLSGEYAGRRSVLEQMPFYVGYGVETGLLLNLVEKYGINAIAQVDLRERIHHNQSLSALSRMAFAIIQVFVEHLEQRKTVELLNDVNRTMKIIRYGMESYFLEEHPISDTLRPPMATLPEYQAKFDGTEQPQESAV